MRIVVWRKTTVTAIVGHFSLNGKAPTKIKPGSAQVGAISKAQKYQKDFKMSNYWWIGDPFMEFFFQKKVSQCRKNTKGGPFGIFQNPFCPKISKNWRWDPSVKIFFSKKKVSQSRKYSLAPLSFLNDIKILLRKLRIVRNWEIEKLRNCKIVRIVRKVDHSEWDCQLKKKIKISHSYSRAFFP